MHTTDRLADNLRAAANFIEAHPDINVSSIRADTYSDHDVCMMASVSEPDQERATFAAFARAMGKTTKSFNDDFAYLAGEHRGVTFLLSGYRQALCRRVVTKRIAPAQPECVLPATPEREVEDVQWICDDGILSPSTGAPAHA